MPFEHEWESSLILRWLVYWLRTLVVRASNARGKTSELAIHFGWVAGQIVRAAREGREGSKPVVGQFFRELSDISKLDKGSHQASKSGHAILFLLVCEIYFLIRKPVQQVSQRVSKQ